MINFYAPAVMVDIGFDLTSQALRFIGFVLLLIFLVLHLGIVRNDFRLLDSLLYFLSQLRIARYLPASGNPGGNDLSYLVVARINCGILQYDFTLYEDSLYVLSSMTVTAYLLQRHIRILDRVLIDEMSGWPRKWRMALVNSLETRCFGLFEKCGKPRGRNSYVGGGCWRIIRRVIDREPLIADQEEDFKAFTLRHEKDEEEFTLGDPRAEHLRWERVSRLNCGLLQPTILDDGSLSKDRYVGRSPEVNTIYEIFKRAKKIALSENRPVNVILEGSIGAGKSTYLKILKDNQNYATIVEEPVREWESLEGNGFNLLENFYKDKRKYAFILQTLISSTMIKSMATRCRTKFRFAERSMNSQKHFFCKMLLEDENISQLEYDVLETFYNNCLSLSHMKVDIFLYLRSKPENLLQRIKKRERPGEERLSLEYLQRLHQLHEEWLLKESAPVIVLKNDDFADLAQQAEDLIHILEDLSM